MQTKGVNLLYASRDAFPTAHTSNPHRNRGCRHAQTQTKPRFTLVEDQRLEKKVLLQLSLTSRIAFMRPTARNDSLGCI
jgi:hypothetical protein